MEEKQYFVYILANRVGSVLYIGVTSDLVGRVWQHKNKIVGGFTSKYNVVHLVYYEIFGDVSEAILREKRLKTWKRSWKDQLIKQMNPTWTDLYDKII